MGGCHEPVLDRGVDASGPVSQARDLCSHPEPCTQENPMLGLMSVVSILKFLVFFFFFELAFCKRSLREWKRYAHCSFLP